MPESIEAISKVASQNDRWLFIAVMFLLLWFAWKVINHLVSQNEQSRTAHLLVLETVVRDAAKSSVAMQDCIKHNSDQMTQNTVVLERCVEELKLIEREKRQ